ncbi:Sulfotransferase [Halocaridina rubra]|uniref:Carbohydrate sulfotransferase n=1 Tax=Halocaridina rubra TaxID=373956 RepID=A0AAN8XFW8_HALRR
MRRQHPARVFITAQLDGESSLPVEVKPSGQLQSADSETFQSTTLGNISRLTASSDLLNQDWDAWHEEQARRKRRINEACMKITDPKKPSRYKYRNLVMRRKTLDHLLVDDIHRAIYCYIPKAGCSNWKRLWMILRGDSNVTNIFDIKSSRAHAYGPKMRLARNGVKTKDVLRKLLNYTKFIVVREPMERLISAYLNKIQYPNGQPIFQRRVLEYAKKRRQSANLTNLEWPEFLGYILDPLSPKNEHWLPFDTLCHPCVIDYDVIIKFESMQEDAERLLRLIKGPQYIHFPAQAKKVDSSVTKSYIENVSPTHIQSFCKTYSKDFEVFEYDQSKYCER